MRQVKLGPIRWCQDKRCGEFARWLTVFTIMGDRGVELWVCDDHREDIIETLTEILVEVGIDAGLIEIRANIKQYDTWVSG